MIHAILYSEFDNVTGPKVGRCCRLCCPLAWLHARFLLAQIIHQTPEGFLSNELFDSVSDYIITGKQLCGKLITVNAPPYKIMSFPLCIEDDKYDRNALLFNVGFVFNEHADTGPFHFVLRKLGNTLLALELESGFLFGPQTKVSSERMDFALTPGIVGAARQYSRPDPVRSQHGWRVHAACGPMQFDQPEVIATARTPAGGALECLFVLLRLHMLTKRAHE